MFAFISSMNPRLSTLSLHDALPICDARHRRRFFLDAAKGLRRRARAFGTVPPRDLQMERSEEHTSELQSPCNLVCRLLLEKKKRLKKQVLTTRNRQKRWQRRCQDRR